MLDYNGRERIGKGVEWDAAGDAAGKAYLIEASARFETVSEAEAFAKQFPAYVKIRVGPLSTYDYSGGKYSEYYQLGLAQLRIHLTPDKVTGAVNETGLKRFRKFIAVCQQLAIPLARVRHYGNSVDFEV